MAAPRYDILAIGNALVDVLCHKDDAFVAAQGLERGMMQPIAPDRALLLHQAMGVCEEVCGGSAANSMAGTASTRFTPWARRLSSPSRRIGRANSK